MVSYEPDSWDAADVNDGYVFDRDSGSYSGPEQIEMFAFAEMEPGEVWEFTLRLTLSSEPSDGPVLLETFDENDDYLFQKIIPSFGGLYIEMSFTVPTYQALGEFSAPASQSGSPSFGFQAAGTDSGNYWLVLEGVRLRSGINDAGEYQSDAETMSGTGNLGG